MIPYVSNKCSTAFLTIAVSGNIVYDYKVFHNFICNNEFSVNKLLWHLQFYFICVESDRFLTYPFKGKKVLYLP